MNDVGFRITATDELSGPVGRARSSLLSLNETSATVSGGLGKIGSGALTAAKNLALIAAPAILGLGALAVASTDAARKFEQDMTLIQTQAGASADEVTNMSAAVLKLAPQVGTGPDELAAGLYHVESAGIRGAAALDVLKVAAEGAKVGNADLESVTNALIAANQSGVKGVEDMTGAMGTLNAIVGAGNMRMQDLTDAMGTGVLSTAKNYGVTIQSVGAALADMTDQGIPAVDAATRLNSAMRLMAAPTAAAAKDLEQIGITSTQLAEDMRGPGGIDAAIHDLKTHLDESGLSLSEQAALIAHAFGGKQSGAILTLIGNVDLLDQKVQAVNAGAAGFGAAWETTTTTVAEEQASLSASIDSLKIQLGNELLPVEQRVVAGLAGLAASPEVQQGVLALGDAISGLFSQQNIDAAMKFTEGVIPQLEDFGKTILPPLVDGLRLAGQVTKQALDMFNQLPEPLKAAIIGGLAVNKLSGGLISSGVSDVLKALTSSGGGAASVATAMKGQTPLDPMWVSVVGGGLGGGLGLPGGAAGTAGGGGAVGDLIAGGGTVGLSGLAIAAAAIIGSAVVVSAAGDLVTMIAGPATAVRTGTERTLPGTGQQQWSTGQLDVMGQTIWSDKIIAAIHEGQGPIHVPELVPVAQTLASISHDTSGADDHLAIIESQNPNVALSQIAHDTSGTDQHVQTVATQLQISHDTASQDAHAIQQEVRDSRPPTAEATASALAPKFTQLGQDIRLSPPPAVTVNVDVATTISARDVADSVNFTARWNSGPRAV